MFEDHEEKNDKTILYIYGALALLVIILSISNGWGCAKTLRVFRKYTPQEDSGEFELLVPVEVNALIKELENGTEDERLKAAKTLAQLGPKAKKAVDALIHALDDPSPKVVAMAAEALGEMGGDAWDAIPKLRELEKNSPKVIVRLAASIALEKITGANRS